MTPSPTLQFVTDEIVAMYIHEMSPSAGQAPGKYVSVLIIQSHVKYIGYPFPAKMLHHRYLEHKEVQTSFFGINDQPEDH